MRQKVGAAVCVVGALAVSTLAAATSIGAASRPQLHDTKIKATLALTSKKTARVKTMRLTLTNGERRAINHAELSPEQFRFTRVVRVTATGGGRALAAMLAPRVRLKGGKLEITGVPGVSKLIVDLTATGRGLYALLKVDNLAGRGNAGSTLVAWGKYDLAPRFSPAPPQRAVYTGFTTSWSPSKPTLIVTNARDADGTSPRAIATIRVLDNTAGIEGWRVGGCGLDSMSGDVSIPPLAPGKSFQCTFDVTTAANPLGSGVTGGEIWARVDIDFCPPGVEKRCSNNHFPTPQQSSIGAIVELNP